MPTHLKIWISYTIIKYNSLNIIGLEGIQKKRLHIFVILCICNHYNFSRGIDSKFSGVCAYVYFVVLYLYFF
jgi:hypothetical protein